MYPFEGQDWNDKRQNTIINSTGLHNVMWQSATIVSR